MSDPDQVKRRALLPLGGYPALLAECRVLGVPDNCRRVVDDSLAYLDNQLRGPETGSARRAARQILRELADLIGSKRLGLTGSDYQRLLRRLAVIFAAGPAVPAASALVSTAPSYGGLVAAIRRACPDCDYEAAVGQLLMFMARLFLERRGGWSSIYRSIRTISDGVPARRRLDTAEFSRLQEWIESGAGNLLPIQRDLARTIAGLGGQVTDLDAAIERKATALERLQRKRRRTREGCRNVVALDAWRGRREIDELRRRRRELMDRIHTKQGIKALVDADIRSVDDSLRSIGRAYFVRLAWSASRGHSRPKPHVPAPKGGGASLFH